MSPLWSTDTVRIARFGCPVCIACPQLCPATLQASGNTNAAAQALAQAAAQGGGSASALAQVPAFKGEATGCDGWGEETACRHACGHTATCKDGLRCLVLNICFCPNSSCYPTQLPHRPLPFPCGPGAAAACHLLVTAALLPTLVTLAGYRTGRGQWQCHSCGPGAGQGCRR